MRGAPRPCSSAPRLRSASRMLRSAAAAAPSARSASLRAHAASFSRVGCLRQVGVLPLDLQHLREHLAHRQFCEKNRSSG
eukprot:COSAG01_NODE_4805_length_4730_cov_579.199482_2_plen_80_part_00